MNDELEFEAPRKVPDRYACCELDRISDDPSFDIVRRYATNMDRYLRAGLGLFLSGPNGVGKSGALGAITQTVKKYKPSWGSRNVVWCRSSDIAIHYGYGKTDSTFDIPVDMLYETARWLVIDELGREQNTKNFDARMIQLLDIRGSKTLVTSFSTNLAFEDVGKLYGEAFVSRLHQSCVIQTVAGSDRRMP